MKPMKTLLSLVMVMASTLAATAQSLNVWLEPATQIVNPGDTVSIGIYASANGTSALALSDAYLSFTWDPAVLTNATPNSRLEPAPWDQSYWAPGQAVNTDLQDGDAQRELLGQLPTSNPVAPVGIMRDPVNRIKVTTLEFTVGSITAPTYVKLWNLNNGATTNFFRGNFAIGQWDLVFENGSYSQAELNPIPEPMTMTVLALGAAFLARRKAKSNRA